MKNRPAVQHYLRLHIHVKLMSWLKMVSELLHAKNKEKRSNCLKNGSDF